MSRENYHLRFGKKKKRNSNAPIMIIQKADLQNQLGQNEHKLVH
jgi:hypothetical protein